MKNKIDCGCEKDVFACRTHAHTPTPWKAAIAPNVDKDRTYIMTESRKRIALMIRNGTQQEPIPHSEADANAAFIVRAVNCHEELLELAKWVADSLRPEERPANVNRLIAKAEGK